MKIVLVFNNVPGNIEDAIADIRVEDQSEADAPAPQLISKRVGPFMVHPSQPVVTLDVDLSVPAGTPEPAIIVRVKARTQNNQPIEFLNTATTLLPDDPNGLVRVELSRII